MTIFRRGRRAASLIVGAAVILAIPFASAAQPQPEKQLSDAEMTRLDMELFASLQRYFPGTEAGLPSKRLFRLTRDQLDLTVASLLPGYVTQSVKEAIPKDALQTNYEYADLLSLNPANIKGLSGWIGGIAARVREKPDGVVNCPDGGNADACRRAAVRAFIVKAFRGDVTEDKITQTTGFYLNGVKSVGAAQAAADLVEVVLNSPNFLFRKELDVSATARLAPAQLLQAVTYTLADAPPEQLKLASLQAADYLRSSKEASATISAIAASKEAREKLVRFFVAWLEIKDAGDFTISPQVFPEFTPKLASAMHDDSIAFLRTQLNKPSPTLRDITQATGAVVSKDTQPLYATKGAASTDGKLVALDPAQRLGIFSQPAVIASHSGPTDTRLIKRGVFWVRKAMCMELEPPPKTLHVKIYEAAGQTLRKRIETMTAAPSCIGCHKVIDPFAFFLESYDALGRWRTVDNGAPIDTSILVNFLDEEPVKTNSTVEGLKVLTDSLMFKQCFVRQLFRFYMGRNEEPSDDPLLRRMLFDFARDDRQDIMRVVQMLASSDRIVRRQ
jgi:hypothetical protein